MTKNKHIRSTRYLMLASAAALFVASPVVAQRVDLSARTAYSIPAQGAGDALNAFSRRSGIRILFPYDAVEGRRSRAINGTMSAEEALSRLLADAGLRIASRENGVVTLTAVSGSGEAEAGGAAADSGSADAAQGVAEILVVGQRTLNADVRRTEDDSQPYVVFSNREIQQSQARTVEEFLRTRLPMETTQSSASQRSGSGARSEFNLRGLGSNQTLVLVDGRRMQGSFDGTNFIQPDLNGIPTSAIERIEVLPATASGIYGGGATGGVINVILRRSYSGLQVTLNYGDTFRGDVSSRRIDVNGGLSLEGGRTHILFSGSRAQSGRLLENERDFTDRARALFLANNNGNYRALGQTTPPLGATTNIVSVNGSNLVLDNGTALNSPITFVPVGYAGPASDGGAALVANAGRYNLDLAESIDSGRRSLLNGPIVSSANLTIRRDFTSWLNAFVDLSWSENRGRNLNGSTARTVTISAANNPFTTPVVVRVPVPGIDAAALSTTETFRVAGGVVVKLPDDWSAALEHVYSQVTDTSRAFGTILGDPDGNGPGLNVNTAIQNGLLNVFRDVSSQPLDYTPYLFTSPNFIIGPSRVSLNSTTLRIGGPLFRLPAGPVSLTGLLERRREASDPTFQQLLPPTNITIYYAPRTQNVLSGYVELRAPLFGAENARPLLRELELQAAVRRDGYETSSPRPALPIVPSVNGPFPDVTYGINEVSATSYTLSARYAPVDGVIIRASYGTGFLPPSISQIVQTRTEPVGTFAIFDPKRGGVQQIYTNVATITGGNPDLQPEESESWSVGAIITPGFAPGLRLSVDYTHIEKTNELRQLQVAQLLSIEDLVPGRVGRAPLTPADAALGYTGGVITLLDTSFANISRTSLDAVDIQANYTINSPRFGRFDLYSVVTWQPNLRRQTLPNTPFLQEVGFFNGPLEWRANFGVEWSRGDWAAGWNGQFFDSYLVYNSVDLAAARDGKILNQGSTRIRSQFYQDVFVRFRTELGNAPLIQGLDIIFGIQNLFNSSPPIVAANALTGQAYSFYGDPRLRRFSLTLRTTF